MPDLTGGMGAHRVVDFAASVDGPTTTARVSIAQKGHERRVVKADALVAVAGLAARARRASRPDRGRRLVPRRT